MSDDVVELFEAPDRAGVNEYLETLEYFERLLIYTIAIPRNNDETVIFKDQQGNEYGVSPVARAWAAYHMLGFGDIPKQPPKHCHSTYQRAITGPPFYQKALPAPPRDGLYRAHRR